MKNDFTGYSPEQLNGVLKFTEALANYNPQVLDTAGMTAENGLDTDGVEAQVRAYIAAKNANKKHIRSRVNETEEDVSIRQSVKDWLKRKRGQK
jgi:hypothetical protein